MTVPVTSRSQQKVRCVSPPLDRSTTETRFSRVPAHPRKKARNEAMHRRYTRETTAHGPSLPSWNQPRTTDRAEEHQPRGGTELVSRADTDSKRCGRIRHARPRRGRRASSRGGVRGRWRGASRRPGASGQTPGDCARQLCDGRQIGNQLLCIARTDVRDLSASAPATATHLEPVPSEPPRPPTKPQQTRRQPPIHSRRPPWTLKRQPRRRFRQRWRCHSPRRSASHGIVQSQHQGSADKRQEPRLTK